MTGEIVRLLPKDGPAVLPPWLGERYPFETRTVESGGLRMSFADAGPRDAPPMVLLHGNPTWSFLWRNIIPPLAERYRVIAPDLIGFGLSDKPTDPDYHSLEGHIANLSHLVRALDLRNLTLVLHEWGGPIGLGYAIENPQNLARLVLMNTWAFVPQSENFTLHWGLRLARSRLGDLLVRRLNTFIPTALRKVTHHKLPKQILDAYRFPFPTAPSRAAVLAFPRLIPVSPRDRAYAKMKEIQSNLRNISAPAAIVWGGLDPVFTKLAAYLLRDDLKNASEPVFLPHASHFVQEDAPEAIAAKILEEKKPVTKLRILG